VTNDHGSSTEWGKTLEEYLQLANSNVVFYDGQDFTVVASDLAYANGINISRDGTVLYVVETVGEKIALFTRNTDTNELMFQQSIDMDSGIDNIELDSEGNLWIGSHPKNAEKLSPS
jgi:arylesterase/paraoxonase